MRGSGSKIRAWRALAVLAALSISASGFIRASAAGDGTGEVGDDSEATEAPMCWSREALAGKPGDKTIVKDTARAIIDPPGIELAPHGKAPRGAIRRIELPKGDKRIALTFDLCEQPYEVAGYDAEIVNVLREEEARATFFGGGKWMMTHPAAAQQIIADPLFEMGNHSWEHRNLRLLEGRRLKDEIVWAQAAYEHQVSALAARRCTARDGRVFELTPANARMRLFRFPFGACKPEALDALAEEGLLPIQWDVSSGDPTKGLLPEAMAAAVLHSVKPGSIVLFHANGRGWSTAAALRILIPALRAKGFELATVTDLMSTKGATWKSEPICYDARPGDVDRHDALARSLSEAYERFYARFAPERMSRPSPVKPNREPAGASPPVSAPVPMPVPAKRPPAPAGSNEASPPVQP